MEKVSLLPLITARHLLPSILRSCRKDHFSLEGKITLAEVARLFSKHDMKLPEKLLEEICENYRISDDLAKPILKVCKWLLGILTFVFTNEYRNYSAFTRLIECTKTSTIRSSSTRTPTTVTACHQIPSIALIPLVLLLRLEM